ncbi:MAG: class I adenylate-forming enzyme family protein [Pseudomonadota bacterium]
MSQAPFRLHHFLLQNAKTQADNIALVDEHGQATTFAAWLTAVETMKEAMEHAGLRPGDRLMIVAENSPILTSLLLAGWMMDAWVMPVNARLSTGEIDHLMEHADPRLVMFTTTVSSNAQAHADRLGANIFPDHDQLAVLSRPSAQPEPVKEAAEDQVAALMYTTGTTGNPKGVMLSHASLAWYARISREIRHMTPQDRTFCVLPLTHIYGLASAFLGTLCAGGSLHTVPRFDPQTVFAALRDGATIMPAVPPMYAQLLDYAAAQGWKTLPDMPLRHIMTGGAPLDPDWKRRVEAFFQIPLYNGYGMTECAPGISTTQNAVLSEATAEDVSCGHPLPELDVRVVPPPGERELKDGVGEIIVKGPNVMLGYYKNPSATADVMDSDGYFHTGDLGSFDADGRLSLSGRSKELIIRSGFNIYPPEVEAALSRHPAVTMAAVVGRPVKGNEEVVAFVQSVPGEQVTETDLQTFLRDYLVPYKCPTHIIIDDALPASSTGKLLKSKMLDAYGDRLPTA